jgi:hypothetical protein
MSASQPSRSPDCTHFHDDREARTTGVSVLVSVLVSVMTLLAGRAHLPNVTLEWLSVVRATLA